MILQGAALAAAMGVGVVVLIRTACTLAPDFFACRPAAARLSSYLLLAASLALCFFFARMHQARRARSRESSLISTASLAALGALLSALLQLKNLLAVHAVPLALFNSWPPLAEASLPWLSSLFMVIFFAAWPRRSRGSGEDGGTDYATPALYGAVVLLLVRSGVLLNLFLSPGDLWFSDLPRAMGAILLPATIIGSTLVVRFLLWVFRTGELGLAEPSPWSGPLPD